jgi:hypothetical protein
MNYEGPPPRAELLLGVRRRRGRAGDSARGQERCQAIHPVEVRDPVLPPNGPIREAGEHRRRRPVELTLGHPVQEDVGTLSAEQVSKRDDRERSSPNLSQPAGADERSRDAKLGDLLSQGPVTEEHDGRLDALPVKVPQQGQEHVLRPSEALGQWGRDNDLHASAATLAPG